MHFYNRLLFFAVDQGDTYADSVLLVVSSEDSRTECEAAGRPACGQGALYSNFTVDPLNATVEDDDVAGVLVSLTNGNATYDNFGDPLTAASYSLRLTSEPRSSVTLSCQGLGPFSVAVPSDITIPPEDWATPVAVSVLTSAPTDARPACASGNRFCSVLVARSEVVAHTVTSADPLYSSLDLSHTDVAVAVDVVHDESDPPKVSAGRFSNLLNALEVTFDMETDRAGFVGSFDCTQLLNLTSGAATTLFGASSGCSFTSASTLKVIYKAKSLTYLIFCFRF